MTEQVATSPSIVNQQMSLYPPSPSIQQKLMSYSTPLSDTIVAIATAIAPAQGSVGIVRLSGSEALRILSQLFKPAGSRTWQSHQLTYGWVCTAAGEVVDEAMGVWMQSPRSYTREDVVEIHCHGGLMAVQGILKLCLSAGARLAEPGEFTLRAFLNGRIDLTQAESIADLVGSASPEAARMALAGVQGQLAQPIRELRQEAIRLLAEVEARIDFEEDLPPLDLPQWVQDLEQVQTQVEGLLATADRGELLRTGLKIAIIGQPNVGKSSLLNAWCGEDRAIVTDLPGTTRDVVDSHLVVRGIPVQVLDTAGIRETDDRVEQLGVNRSRALAQEADIVLLVVAADLGWTAVEQALWETIQSRPVIGVVNKVDLVNLAQVSLPSEISHRVEAVASQGQGIPELEAAVESIAVRHQVQIQDGIPVAINRRQQAALLKTQSSLAQAREAQRQGLPLDFWTIDLRDGIRALGEVIGEDVTESVLDRIFSQFCIGK